MKWMQVIATVALLAVSAYAEEEEAGDARLGYIQVGTGGTTSLTFNATSIQNAVILGLFLLVLGALLLPLFNINMEEDEGYGQSYGYEQTGYETPSDGYGQGYAKRSLLHSFAPIVERLAATQKKYEDDAPAPHHPY